MTFPDSIKIGARYYKVIPMQNIDSKTLAGRISNHNMTIELDLGMCEHKRKEVILHEIFHAIIDMSCRSIKKGELYVVDTPLEDLCDILSIEILQIIQDNPALILYLGETNK